MKRLFIIVEGQTEQEFVKTLVAPYLQKNVQGLERGWKN